MESEVTSIRELKRCFTYLIVPTDLGRGGNEGLSVTLCERALLARCLKYSSLENCGLADIFSSGFGVVGLIGTGFEVAFDKLSMKLYTTAFSVKYNVYWNRSFLILSQSDVWSTAFRMKMHFIGMDTKLRLINMGYYVCHECRLEEQ